MLPYLRETDDVKPLWISHRGYKPEGVENTRAAFDAAVARGFRALETDLRLTADGHIVLHHDPTLQRLAGDPREVAQLTRAELAEVPLTGGGRLMFLDEFLAAYRDHDWTFDIKPEGALATIAALPAAAGRARFVHWSEEHESALLARFPKARCFARESECWRAGVTIMLGMTPLAGLKSGRCYAVPPSLGPVPLYTDRVIGAYHRADALVIAFLPRTDAEARAAVAAGADLVLTDGAILEV